MDSASLSAFSALAGSAIGALASVATSWLTQRFQGQEKRLGQQSSRRERLFSDFLDQASKTYAEGMTQEGLDDPAPLVPLYATMNKLRLIARPQTVAAAQAVMDDIIRIYDQPSGEIRLRSADLHSHDILRVFAELARGELAALG